MSAEEIKKLAEPLCRDRAVSVYNKSLDEFVADGCVTLKYRDALLAYAAMVERCEEVVNGRFDGEVRDVWGVGDVYTLDTVMAMQNYILRGDAGKEEK